MPLIKVFILTVFILGNSNKVSAQIFHCPLRNLQVVKEDTGFEYPSDPPLGISFKSSCDTVFSILEGKVVNLKTYTKHKHSITIESENNIQTTYSFIENSELKNGEKIVVGRVIGTLYTSDLKREYVLLMLIRKNKVSLSKSKCLKLFTNCVSTK